MDKLIRRIDLSRARGDEARALLRREWLATNGLGGYASGTIGGTVTWRYHGLLIAALPAPLGRMVLLNHLAEYIRLPDGRTLQIGGEEPAVPEEGDEPGHCLTEFRLENGLPVWRYETQQVVLEKRLVFVYGQNTVHVDYQLLSPQECVRLELRPSFHFRGHEHAVTAAPLEGYRLSMIDSRYEVSAPGMPTVRLVLEGDEAQFTYLGGCRREIFYQKEADRGSPSRGSLWCPGYFCVTLRPRRNATLIASTESWHNMLALTAEEAVTFYHDRHRRLISLADPRAQVSPAADLVLAADQFIINPVGRLVLAPAVQTAPARSTSATPQAAAMKFQIG